MPAMQESHETWVRFLGGEDPLEKSMVTHSSISARRIPWTEEPGRLQSMGLQSQTQLKWLSMHVISSDSGIKECFMKILPDPNKLESLFYFLDLENIFLTVSQLALHKLWWKIALVSSVSLNSLFHCWGKKYLSDH